MEVKGKAHKATVISSKTVSFVFAIRTVIDRGVFSYPVLNEMSQSVSGRLYWPVSHGERNVEIKGRAAGASCENKDGKINTAMHCFDKLSRNVETGNGSRDSMLSFRIGFDSCWERNKLVSTFTPPLFLPHSACSCHFGSLFTKIKLYFRHLGGAFDGVFVTFAQLYTN